MPLSLQQSDYFLADVEIQFRWYLEKADVEVARRYRAAVQTTLRKLLARPERGRRRFAQEVVAQFGREWSAEHCSA